MQEDASMRGKYLWIALILVLFFDPFSHAQMGPKDGAGLPATDLERVKIGDKAPDFTLENMDGKKITLTSYRGKKNVVLVFYRGYW
jgi:cytochrome oxidase Cu insertion factor (SCO1/SenC/PrrC family)